MDIVLYCQTEGDARFACARAGCQDCMAALLREHKGLISLMLRKQCAGQAEWADLNQIGRMALWYAITHFDLNRGIRFSTFACLVIQHWVWAEVARVSRKAGWLETLPHQDQVDEVNRAWELAQLREALEEGLEELSARQRLVIERHYGWDGSNPQKMDEIGEELGVSGGRVSQIHMEALMLLRRPGLSIQLRSLCERHSREEYRVSLRKNWAWQRMYRGRK